MSSSDKESKLIRTTSYPRIRKDNVRFVISNFKKILRHSLRYNKSIAVHIKVCVNEDEKINKSKYDVY
jgi:hypothetical protein